MESVEIENFTVPNMLQDFKKKKGELSIFKYKIRGRDR